MDPPGGSAGPSDKSYQGSQATVCGAFDRTRQDLVAKRRSLTTNSITDSENDCSMTEDTTGTKRKSPTSPKKVDNTESDDGLIAALSYIKSTLMSAINSTNDNKVNRGNSTLVDQLKKLTTVLDKTLTTGRSKDNQPLRKRTKEAPPSPPRSGTRPMVVDASTDMELTPGWWHSEKIRTAEDQAKKMGKGKAAAGTFIAPPNDTGAESAMETDGEGWQTRRPKRVRVPKA